MTTASFSLKDETLDALRSRAREAGVPISALLDLCIRFGVSKLPLDAVQKLAKGRPLGRPPGGPKLAPHLKAKATQALGGIAALAARGVLRCTADEIAHAVDEERWRLKLSLSSLCEAGLVGTAGELYWLKEHAPTFDLESAWALVEQVRAVLKESVIDATEHAVMERDHAQRLGVSPASLRYVRREFGTEPLQMGATMRDFSVRFNALGLLEQPWSRVPVVDRG